MKDALNNGLIKAMREHLPEETNLANYIMDIISIGKEAVYRRLRGEVPFTFYEVSLLSQSLGISLDQIVGTNRAGKDYPAAVSEYPPRGGGRLPPVPLLCRCGGGAGKILAWLSHCNKEVEEGCGRKSPFLSVDPNFRCGMGAVCGGVLAFLQRPADGDAPCHSGAVPVPAGAHPPPVVFPGQRGTVHPTGRVCAAGLLRRISAVPSAHPVPAGISPLWRRRAAGPVRYPCDSVPFCRWAVGRYGIEEEAFFLTFPKICTTYP